jgi:hypothetical protein
MAHVVQQAIHILYVLRRYLKAVAVARQLQQREDIPLVM